MTSEHGWEIEWLPRARPIACTLPRMVYGTMQLEAVWTGKIGRSRWCLGEYNAWIPLEYSTWAPIQRTFHDKSNFGRLVFISRLVAVDKIELAGLRYGLLVLFLEEIRLVQLHP